VLSVVCVDRLRKYACDRLWAQTALDRPGGGSREVASCPGVICLSHHQLTTLRFLGGVCAAPRRDKALRTHQYRT
jgi:hypothetical protein